VEFHRDGVTPVRSGIPSGAAFGDDLSLIEKVRGDSRMRNIPLVSDNQDVDARTGNVIGSYGIKQDYVQNTPAANFPPINYKMYASMLVFDEFIKNLLKEKEESIPLDFVPVRTTTQYTTMSGNSTVPVGV